MNGFLPLPPTAEEIREIHGAPPVTLGGAVEVRSLVGSAVPSGITSGGTSMRQPLVPTLPWRRIYAYATVNATAAFANDVTMASYCMCDCVFTLNQTTTARLPMSRGVGSNSGGANSLLPFVPIITSGFGLSYPITIGNATAPFPSENCVLATGGGVETFVPGAVNPSQSQMFTVLSPFTVYIPADEFHLEIQLPVNCPYSIYVLCYSMLRIV